MSDRQNADLVGKLLFKRRFDGVERSRAGAGAARTGAEVADIDIDILFAVLDSYNFV